MSEDQEKSLPTSEAVKSWRPLSPVESGEEITETPVTGWRPLEGVEKDVKTEALPTSEAVKGWKPLEGVEKDVKAETPVVKEVPDEELQKNK